MMTAPVVPPVTRWALALAGLAVAVIGWQLYGLFPPEVWRQAAATFLTEGLLRRPWWAQAGTFGPLVAVALLVGLERLQRRRARLILDDSHLRFQSGVPVLAPWLDWQLPLDGLRRGHPRLRLTTAAVGSNPLALTRLGWGLTGWRGVRPALWLPAGSPLPSSEPLQPPPHRPMGFVNWRHPRNAAWLQQQFEALPLVRALVERGVDLPAWQALQTAAEGPDLMAHPRLRAVLMSLAGLVLSGGLCLHLARHQHYTAPWSLGAWLSLSTVIAVLTLAWHLTLAPPMPADRSSRWALRFAQGLTTALMVVMLGWNLYHLPLAWGRAFAPVEMVDHVLDLDAARLRPASPGASTPEIAIDPRARRWRDGPDGAHHQVALRRGWGGWWMQYDTEAMLTRSPDTPPDPRR